MPLRAPFPERRTPMESPTPQLTVVGVYDIASDIGKEFEKVIDAFGADAFTHLMPKVVTALEHLESFTDRDETYCSQLDELRSVIVRLEGEILSRVEDKDRFEREIEQLEENWRDETKELLDLVSRLKEENNRLNSSLREKDGLKCNHESSHEQDMKVLQKMKGVIDGQRDQLRAKEKSIAQNSDEIDALQSQLDQVTKINREVRRKHKSTQVQMRLLIEEKAELQAQLQEQQRIMQTLKQNLGVAQKDKEDLIKAKNEGEPSTKAVLDENDPHVPRFTVNELRNILFERNELKARVSELEDELAVYKPKPSLQDPSDDDDPPVQGPINQEPPDAPWKKQESGIRKFFRVLFGTRPEDFRPPSLIRRQHSSLSQPTLAFR